MSNGDLSSPEGTWYLNANGYRLAMVISPSGNGYSGTIQDEGGPSHPLSDISWDPGGRWLEFARRGPGFYQWYRLSQTYGVVSGRFSHSSDDNRPPLTDHDSPVTGWSPSWLDRDIVPRTWALTIGNFRAVLRVDRDGAGYLQGRLKVFDDVSRPDGPSDDPQEELEDDLSSLTWDGTYLAFTRRTANFTQTYEGTADGRFLSGTFRHNGGPGTAWTGTRSEVLGFGLGSRIGERDAWQHRTRAAIVNLTEGMRLINRDIPPITAADQGNAGPFLDGFPPERDDDHASWPPSYTVKRYRFEISPGSRFDPSNPPPPRVFDGYLATPTDPPPKRGYPAVVAVNGHWADARSVMTSSSAYGYGESAARRKFVVLALDIGHRTDDPVHHPAIVDRGYGTSNWEEDGERAFSVRRAVDWLLGQPGIRKDGVLMMGLSMGGEVTTITTGLDTRVAMAVAAGYAPDMNVMDVIGNHPCYRWERADIHEYLDVSDFEALTAPRPLVVETGLGDATFSRTPTPWAADKQVTRRARAAYGADAGRLLHYLHDGGHAFRYGGRGSNGAGGLGVTVAAVTEPTAPGDQTWQTDSSTRHRSASIYDLIAELAP